MKNKLREGLKEKWYRQNFIVACIVFILISCLSIGYSILSQNLNITGEVVIRTDKDIRVTSIKNVSTDTCGYDIYNPKYNEDSVTINLNLPSLNCIAVYTVTIKNKSAKSMEIIDIINESYNNDNIVYNISGLSIGDILSSDKTITFDIIFKYKEGITVLPNNNDLGAIIKFLWKEYIPIIVEESKPEAPVMAANMIPVKWNGNNLVKADISNTESNKWYDYKEYMWANAVTVINSKRQTYISAPIGTAIPITDILTMEVWIPRYKYKLWNAQNGSSDPQIIDIVFESKTTSPSCGGNVCTSNRMYSTGINGEYLTHPAFNFGDEELSGIWVGKFETTGTIASPTILPTNASIRNQRISAMYDSSVKMDDANNIYGYPSTVDTHLMKNMEWGAVTYLYHSKYGKYGNVLYASNNKEIWKNNSATFETGCIGGSQYAITYTGCQNEYYTTLGLQGSTTGNVYGIYDMAGGANEYVMGAMYNSDNTTIVIASSGFSQATIDSASIAKYINKYAYSTDNKTHNRSFLGDAIKETLKTYGLSASGGWYGSQSNFIIPNQAWILRGGSYTGTSGTGPLSFGAFSGAANGDYFGYRVVHK